MVRHRCRFEAVRRAIRRRSVFMVHKKNLKSSNDRPRWTRAPAPGGGAEPMSPTAAPARHVPALPLSPTTVWPWWAHMDPSYPEALFAFLEMRLRRKYLQDRRPERCLISNGTQTDDVPPSPADAHSMSPPESPRNLTSVPPDAHSLRQHQSLKQLTNELANAHNSTRLASSQQLTGEPDDAHILRPLESQKHLTSEPSDADSSRPLDSLKHLTSEQADAHTSRPLDRPKHLSSEPADAHSSSPLQSLKKLISELVEAHSSVPHESLKHFTREMVDTHSSRQFESLKHLISEPADAHSSRPLGSPKHLPSEPTDTNSSRSLGSPKHLTSEPSCTQNLKPLESLTHPTNEPANAHSLRTVDSPKHFSSEAADTHNLISLENLKRITGVPADTPRSRLLESLKHFTNELFNAHSLRPLKSPKHLTSERANTQSSMLLTSEPSDAHSSRPLDSPKHLTSEHPQFGNLGQHNSHIKSDECDKLRDSRHSASSSLENKQTKSHRGLSALSHSPHNTQFTSNQQSPVQNSLASTTIGAQWQEIQRSPFATPRMEEPQSHSVAISSDISTTRTFSMKDGEWYVEQESSISKVNPDAESNRNYPSTHRNIDQMLICKALNPKPQIIFQNLSRFQSKSSINSDTSIKCSLPFDEESTARKDFNQGNSTCKIPTENTCKKDFLKVDKDILVYTFKDRENRIFYPDFKGGRRSPRRVEYHVRTSHRRKKSLDELCCIYFNRAASYSSLPDSKIYESDSSSSELNLFFTTMNFGTAFSDSESSSGSASSSYSPRRAKDREECIDLRSAFASENQHIEKTEEVLSKQNAQVPVSRTRCQHSSVRPLPFNNEQHSGVGTVTATTASTAVNYCEIHDSARERFEVEFLRKAVSKLFDMNPEDLKGDNKSFPVLMESNPKSTPSTSRRSPGRSPRTSWNINRKTNQSRPKQSDEGIFARAWRNIVRLVQRKTDRTQDLSKRAASERTVQYSCATLSSGKSGTKDRDSNPDATFTPRVTTLSPIDEVPETTTSGSSIFGTGPSSSEISTSNRRKM